MKGTSPSRASRIAATGISVPRWGVRTLINSLAKGTSISIVYVGIDLAKNVFALHGVSATGAAQQRQPKVARNKLREVVAALPPCTIGIEACSGAAD
jgi:transposase